MSDPIEKIDKLDISIFNFIHSQSKDGDKRSLLAVQRATAKMNNAYAYLEIGSHLGGSIQSHLVDARCKAIYSIDPRPLQQPDDRAEGHMAYYVDNSTERMLSNLAGIKQGDISKIQCFDSDASDVDPAKIIHKPQILFIDGEHTESAVFSDFKFCESVASENASILFHDVGIIYPAIIKICAELRRQNCFHVPLMLEGQVFALFFDRDIVHRDPYLSSLSKRHKNYLQILYWKKLLGKKLPTPLVCLLKSLWNQLVKKGNKVEK
jgi:hypothetical protein